MEQPPVTASEPSAAPGIYNQFYYQNCCGMPYTRNAEWLRFFGEIADRIVRDIGPASALDAGCALGFLVECLRERGVEAFGIDLSDFAIASVHPSIQPYCRVASVLDPLPHRYDLIVCMEVLEHLTPAQAGQAVANFCQAADDILFCSTPDDYQEATHINVQPQAYWAGLFARHNFFRDVDFDATFITPWAMRFRRSRDPFYRVVEAYERRLWLAARASAGSRALALQDRQQLAERDRTIAQLQSDLAQAQTLAVAQALQPLRAELQSQQSARQQLEATLQSERAAHEHTSAWLAEIQTSPGWRFVLKAGRLRERLLPNGTRRARWWRSVINRLSR
jgi:hypothetical protein